ncbi:Uncharacterised protein [Sphingobacterium thalpophilum]|uniref:Uncharacterized protein n=1 Tax=Sphingobacterium thalpophilum TaxID=259 RepID=A0A4U9VHL6_9SPHI|nr:Uncharacterised protein [Sphingobacterium thalpophilum]
MASYLFFLYPEGRKHIVFTFKLNCYEQRRAKKGITQTS